jgi:hypothetical protein
VPVCCAGPAGCTADDGLMARWDARNTPAGLLHPGPRCLAAKHMLMLGHTLAAQWQRTGGGLLAKDDVVKLLTILNSKKHSGLSAA